MTESSQSSEPTDSELIAASIDDPRQFMPITTRHQRVLFGYLARRVGPVLAEDIVAETFARAFAQRDRFDLSRDDARPWLFGIATNLMRNQARSEARRLRAYTRHGVNDHEHPDDDATVARLDADARSRALAAALDKLAPRDRDVLTMFAWGDLSYEEIADSLGVPVGTVRSRLNRARRLVKESLDADSDAASATHRPKDAS